MAFDTAFLGGSSTWARTRDLRINRKPGSLKSLINQRLISIFSNRAIFRVITQKLHYVTFQPSQSNLRSALSFCTQKLEVTLGARSCEVKNRSAGSWVCLIMEQDTAVFANGWFSVDASADLIFCWPLDLTQSLQWLTLIVAVRLRVWQRLDVLDPLAHGNATHVHGDEMLLKDLAVSFQPSPHNQITFWLFLDFALIRVTLHAKS